MLLERFLGLGLEILKNSSLKASGTIFGLGLEMLKNTPKL